MDKEFVINIFIDYASTFLLGLGIFLGFILFCMTIDALYFRGKKTNPSLLEFILLMVKIVSSNFYKPKNWKRLAKPDHKLSNKIVCEPVFTPDVKHITDYMIVTDQERYWSENSQVIPPVYLCSTLLYPLMNLFATKKFIFPVMGTMHMSTKLRLYQDLSVKENYSAKCAIDENLKITRSGVITTSLQTVLDSENRAVWTAISEWLTRCKNKYTEEEKEKDKTAAKAELSLLEEYENGGLYDVEKVCEEVWYLPASRGLEYASVSKDFNPFHLTKKLGKLMGFKSHFIHGIYSMSKCIHRLSEVNSKMKLLQYPLEADCEFKSPIFLPSSPRLQIYTVTKRKKTKATDDKFLVYQVIDMIQKRNRETKEKYTELGVLVQGSMKNCPLESMHY